MAQVPYRPVPTGQPVSVDPQVRLNVPGAAFGTNIGEALVHRGGALTELGDGVYKSAMEYVAQTNEFNARQKVVDFQTAAGDLQAKFDKLPPDQKMSSLTAHYQAIKDLHKSYMGQLWSAQEQQMFDREAAPFTGRLIFSSAGRAGDEYQTWQGKEAEAGIARSVNSVAAGTINEIKSKHKTIDETYDAAAPNLKYGPQELALKKDIAKSQSTGAAIDFWLANGKPEKAQEIMDSPLGKTLLDKDRTAALNKINANIVSKVGIEEGRKLIDANVPETELKARAKEAAKNYFPDNPEARSQLEKNIISNALGDSYSEAHIDRLQENKAAQNVYDIISSDDPRARGAQSFQTNFPTLYNQLSPRIKAGLAGWLAEMWNRHDKDTEKASFNRLTRLATDDPRAFLDEDILDPKWHLSDQDTKGFIATRRRIINQGVYKDREVQDGIGIMNHAYPSELKALGVFQPPPRGVDNPVYDEYITQMQQGIQTFIEQKGHRPNAEEFLQYIRPGLLRIRPPTWMEQHMPGILGGVSPTGKEPMELVPPIPPAEMEKIRNEILDAAAKAGNPLPTNREISSAISQARWMNAINEIERSSRGRTTGGTPGGPAPPGPTQ